MNKTVKNRSLSSWSLLKFDPQYMTNIPLSGKFETYHLSTNPVTNEMVLKSANYKAADYITEDHQFRIVVIDQNKNDILDNEDEIFVTNISSDSVFTVGNFSLGNKNPLTIKNRDKRFKIFFEDNHLASVYVTDNKTSRYNWEYVDHLNKDYDIKNRNGEKVILNSYLNSNDKLYILNTSTTCKGCINALSELDRLIAITENLKIVIIFQSSDSWTKIDTLIQKFNSLRKNGIIAKSYDSEFRKDYDFITYPDGILFENDGQLLNNHILPDRLRRLIM